MLTDSDNNAPPPPPVDIVGVVRGLCEHVFDVLGMGHSEAVYQKALEYELRMNDIGYGSAVCVPIFYKGTIVGRSEADIVIHGTDRYPTCVIELKAVASPMPMTWNQQLAKYVEGLKCMLKTEEVLGVVFNFTQAKK